MDALLYLNYVKCENEGAKRTGAAMKSFNLPEPEFEQKQVGGAIVRVTLHNSQNLQAKWIDSDVTGIVGPDVADQMWRTN